MSMEEYTVESAMIAERNAGREEGREEGREVERNEVLELINRGFTIEEIKQHLESTMLS